MERQPDRCGADHRPGDCRPSSWLEEHAATLGWLGRSHVDRAQYGPARECYQRALDLAGETDPGEASSALSGLATTDLREGAYPAARERFERALAMRQQIGDRAGEAATWHQLGSLAAQLGKAAEGLRLLALCYLIDREIGHGDADSDHTVVAQHAAQLNYTPEQLAAALQETAESYAGDRGVTLLREAFD
jgi:tetratricopeptide (TPR) repeat protein